MTASENLRLRGPEGDVREALGLAELYTAWERVLLCACLRRASALRLVPRT
jgi:hypothetical protein